MFNNLRKQKFNNKTEFKNTNEFNLTSPRPFKNELSKYNLLYIIFPIIFIIFIGNELGELFSILIGLCGAFVIINIIAAFKVGKLRRTEFDLPTVMSKEEIIDLITLPLTQLNMRVENLSKYIRITHNKIQYDILVSPYKNTFRIWPQKSFLSFLFARVYIKLYKNAITSMPIISYTIQIAVNKSTEKI